MLAALAATFGIALCVLLAFAAGVLAAVLVDRACDWWACEDDA